MPLVGSCECRPDFRQLVANGSFAIEAFFIGQIRPALLRRIGRLHRYSAANRLDVEGWYLVRENDGSRCEQHREPNAPLKNDAHAIPRQFVATDCSASLYGGLTPEPESPRQLPDSIAGLA
jgi:hypothetical protein